MAGLIAKDGGGLNVFNTVNVGDLESFEDTVIDVTPQQVEGGDV
jgi:K+-sensing histidine kinase KdpD